MAILQSTVWISGFCPRFIIPINFTIFIKNKSHGTIHIFKNYFITVFSVWVMLTSAFRTLIKNSIKESFCGKKKAINVLITFFIPYKSDIKTFLKWIVNQYAKAFISISLSGFNF